MEQLRDRAELLVCIKCRASAVDAAQEPRPGLELFEALRDDAGATGLSVTAVECLSNCSNGCSIALRSTGKWTYVYGNLTPELASVVIDGARKYDGSEDGLVPWRERPEHFRKNCIARIPPLEIRHETT